MKGVYARCVYTVTMHVISASRRTDLPAFYTDWLLARLKTGECLVRNPFNGRVAPVSLRPEDVLAFVFWSKQPRPLLPHLPGLLASGQACYFQYTLNAYGELLEPGLPPLARRVETARALADVLGPPLVVWRYDPLVESGLTPWAWHLERFGELAEALRGASKRCVISFVSLYRRTRLRLDDWAARHDTWYRFVGTSPAETARARRGREYAPDELRSRASDLSAVAAAHGFALESCCGPGLGLPAARCIDPELVGLARGETLTLAPRPTREGCGCVASIDIGAYETCPAGCGSTYCYAVQSHARALSNRRRHEPSAERL